MSENGKTSYIEENETPNWLANNLHRLMIWVSIIWFGIVLIYISQFFGWSNLFLMMPDEFGAFLAGVTLPLAIIWVHAIVCSIPGAISQECVVPCRYSTR